MKDGRRSSLRGTIFSHFMEMKLGVCLLLVCEIPGREMLIVEGGRRRLRLSQTRTIKSDAPTAWILILLCPRWPTCEMASLPFCALCLLRKHMWHARAPYQKCPSSPHPFSQVEVVDGSQNKHHRMLALLSLLFLLIEEPFRSLFRSYGGDNMFSLMKADRTMAVTTDSWYNIWEESLY